MSTPVSPGFSRRNVPGRGHHGLPPAPSCPLTAAARLQRREPPASQPLALTWEELLGQR